MFTQWNRTQPLAVIFALFNLKHVCQKRNKMKKPLDLFLETICAQPITTLKYMTETVNLQLFLCQFWFSFGEFQPKLQFCSFGCVAESSLYLPYMHEEFRNQWDCNHVVGAAHLCIILFSVIISVDIFPWQSLKLSSFRRGAERQQRVCVQLMVSQPEELIV